MKYIFLMSIVIVFGLVGYIFKLKMINQKRVIQTIKEYVEFYDSNITIFKTNLIEINNKYIIMQKNKNANINIIKLNYANISEFDLNLIKNSLLNIEEVDIIINYFCNIGKLDYEDEKNKNKQIVVLLERVLLSLENQIKTKGELWFKTMLAIGAVIAILIW